MAFWRKVKNANIKRHQNTDLMLFMLLGTPSMFPTKRIETVNKRSDTRKRLV